MMVRRLNAGDAAAWHGLMTEATRSHPAAFLLSPDELAAMTPEQIQANMDQGRLRGLFHGDRLLGFAGLHLWQMDRLRHRADIGPFYITPDVRGAGAADRLMDALADVARANAVTWLDLWVAASNGRARAFYRRHGFKEIATREDAVRMGDVSEDDVLMTRRLGR
ncbi:hypothetical protein JANAI62_35640 [Jannaschia pagri]|uniref:N-acetyltransferase domain-containing protein n=1 Tax=Jannaschia pagri TaxID=2829797 RepID=A0ABQ4NRB5_9RHOB|nr:MULTISPECIES: GNAT family N-acetyltransferase [unclassified Jannaschia]GIT93152.1 hypothetical protein JANAI61_36100 [Jannaschia sp. AI_61]GIT96941.1 hypothetical protein JANAI62_35640 [Jannaschia sp. AI_62]